MNVTRKNNGKGGNLGHFNSNKEKYTQTKTGYPKSILKFKRENEWHPTQKPLGLIKFLIKTYTNVGEFVLDNTCGSDTTGIASFELGRNSISIEINKEIFDLAKKRRSKHNMVIDG